VGELLGECETLGEAVGTTGVLKDGFNTKAEKMVAICWGRSSKLCRTASISSAVVSSLKSNMTMCLTTILLDANVRRAFWIIEEDREDNGDEDDTTMMVGRTPTRRPCRHIRAAAPVATLLVNMVQ